MRVVVAGYIVRGPLGGMAWHHLQYVLGLARLGHDVAFVEDSDDYPACYDPECEEMTEDPSYGLRFARAAFARLGLGDRWAYHDAHVGHWRGPLAEEAESWCRNADVVLNVSGANPLRPWLLDAPVRVLIDTDPVFTQVRHLGDRAARREAERYTSFFTFGENFGRSGCTIPDDGFAWAPTRQPVVLDAWQVTQGRRRAPWTTVMQWQAYPPVEYEGARYGLKVDSFEPYANLPERTSEKLEIALGSAGAPRRRLRKIGWRVRDPHQPIRDPWAYQRYVRESKGEFSVAKHGYVASRSGWFSERSAAYLASGRPVVIQDTGFSEWMETGTGVVAINSPEEALAGLADVEARYEEHCRAARRICERYFDSAAVLGSLLERASA